MCMRGDERIQDGMFSYVSLEQRVPVDHPLRQVRRLTDGVLRSLNAELDELYADSGRPSIAPEYILRALLLQVFFSIRSERLLVEQIDYNLLFRWFVGLGMDDAVWNHAVFSKNRDRLLSSVRAARARHGEFFACLLSVVLGYKQVPTPHGKQMTGEPLMGISPKNNFGARGWISVPDQPTEWELMLVSLELTEDEAWRQLEISGAKSCALRLWIEQNHHQRYIPPQFLWRRA